MNNPENNHQLGEDPKAMLHLQHNVVNITHVIRNMVESHLSRYEQSGVQDPAQVLKESESVFKRILDLSSDACAITRRIGLAMRAQRDPDEIPEATSVQEVWKDVVEILEKKYSLKFLEIIERIPNEFPRVECKKSELFEIFYYLAQNSIQAMHRRGKLIVRAHIQFKSGENPTAVITISDTGPGIPETILPQLFEPFVTTKPWNEGNGLGLCLVKSLVRKNQGSIWISSFQGFGTTVSLSLQAAKSRKLENQYASAG